ncbi:MAG: hypothetical protein K2L50_07375 [Bacteroidales bacterium]|nr:hypothetical protein [Bacteroidales bacterium]
MSATEVPVLLSSSQRKEERNRAIYQDYLDYKAANPRTPKTTILTALAYKYGLSQPAMFAIAKKWKAE